MEVFYTKKNLKARLSPLKSENCTLALVPTMGALHEGHLALVYRALAENDIVVVSIFINPTQFNNPEDLLKYPKSLEKDLALLRKVSETIVVFAPSTEEMYPNELRTKNYNFGGLEMRMEGLHRPGHFNGVGTIVEELLKTVAPQTAYFGEKDYQQLQIVRKLVSLEKLPVQVVGCPIVREPSGLAMSSRNERLSKRLRIEASFIYKTLRSVKEKFGTKSANYLTDWVFKEFNARTDLELEYFSIADAETLVPVKRKQKNKKYRAFIAVYADDIRLIDNIALN